MTDEDVCAVAVAPCGCIGAAAVGEPTVDFIEQADEFGAEVAEMTVAEVRDGRWMKDGCPDRCGKGVPVPTCAERGGWVSERFGISWDGHMRDESGCCVDCGYQR